LAEVIDNIENEINIDKCRYYSEVVKENNNELDTIVNKINNMRLSR
jgi:hypothetical protein